MVCNSDGDICAVGARLVQGIGDFFLDFLEITVHRFGSVLPWARREFVFVSVGRWMSQDEFNELFSLCQFLPGSNTVTFALVYGHHIRGVAGVASRSGRVAAT